jgi:hypothetical protein
MLHGSELRCAVLCCAVPCCVVLRCATLELGVLYYSTVCTVLLHSAVFTNVFYTLRHCRCCIVLRSLYCRARYSCTALYVGDWLHCSFSSARSVNTVRQRATHYNTVLRVKSHLPSVRLCRPHTLETARSHVSGSPPPLGNLTHIETISFTATLMVQTQQLPKCRTLPYRM